MPETLSSLLVVLLALLPGGLHTWAFERVTGKSQHQVSDRILRLLVASALYLVLAVPAIPIFSAIAKSAMAGATTAAWRYVAVFVILILIPMLIGSTMGWLTNQRHQKGVRGWLGRRIGGVGYANRAWDHLFGVKGLEGTIRVILTDGTQIIGKWARRDGGGAAGEPPTRSYASGYPTEQRDLYISQLIRIDYPNASQTTSGAAWIPGESVRYVEFYPKA
jgi:Family of unknown function (DUF6338)